MKNNTKAQVEFSDLLSEWQNYMSYMSGKIPNLGVELEPIHGGHNATSFWVTLLK